MPFNGGKSQVNFNFLQGGGEDPFLNRLKGAQAWSWADGSGLVAQTPDLFDSDGYPTTIVHSGVVTGNCFIPSQVEYPGHWVLDWTGNGTCNIGVAQGTGTVSTVTGSLTTSSGSGYYEFQFTGGDCTAVNISITAIGPSTHITNLRLYNINDAAALAGGGIFGAKFKARLIEANFGVLRFLNWQVGNTSNATNWDTANKPTTYYQYNSGQLRADFLCNSAGSGITTNTGGADYTISASSAWTGLNDKATVHIVWNRSSPVTSASLVSKGSGNNVTWSSHGLVAGNQVYFTDTNGDGTGAGSATGITLSLLQYPFTNPYTVASVTDANNIILTGVTLTAISAIGRPIVRLNVGGTSLVPVLDQSCAPMTGSGNTFPIGGSENSFSTLVYDADIAAWMNTGGNLSAGKLFNCVPYSVMLQLCKEVGAHPWFVGLPLTLTPMSDFVTQLATLCKTYAAANAPWMIPRFEGCNELWNTAGGFTQTHYASSKTVAYGWGSSPDGDINNWYGKSLSTLGQAVNSVYGGSPTAGTAYKVVCGIQTSGFTAPTSSSDDRLKSTKYIGTTPQSGYSATAGVAEAWRWTTAVCCANYVNPSFYGRNNEIVLAYDWWINTGNRATDAAAYEATLLDGFNVTFSNGSPSGTVNSVAPHGLAAGEIINLLTSTTFPTGITAGNYWINTVPTTTTFTLSSSDPNNGGTTLVAVSGATSAVSFCGPNGGNFTIPASKVSFTNIAAWAAGIGVNQVCYYEGGYSPDYDTHATAGKITGGTNTTNCVLTIPAIWVQFIRNPTEQQTTTNPGLVAGMYLKLSGMPASGGWNAFENQVVLITAVSGTSVTTNLNASGATNSLVTALAGGHAFGDIYFDNGTTTAITGLNALRKAAKDVSNLQADTTALYNICTAISGGEFPSMFQLGGTGNVWSVLDPDIYVSPNPPQWLAAIAFNAGSSGPAGPTNTFAFSITMQGTARITTKMVGY